MASRPCASIHPDPATGRSTSAAGSATPPGGSPGSWDPRARRSASTPHRGSSTPLAGRRRRQRWRTRASWSPMSRPARSKAASTTPSRGSARCSSPTPSPACGNVRRALAPGGRLCMVVWRRKPDNEWLHRAERVVERLLSRPEVTDEPTCGPGPFSMADADTTTDVLVRAGFRGDLAASLRQRDRHRLLARGGGGVRDGARSGGRADPPRRPRRRATSPGHRGSPP